METKSKRFIIFPIEHESIYRLYQKQKQAQWEVEEIDFTKDRDDFETFKPDEQKMIKNVMALFATSDAIVNEMIILRLMTKTPFEESRLFYGAQMDMEMTHTVTYAKQIQETVRDQKEQQNLFEAIHGMEGVKRLTQWYIDKMEDPSKTFAEYLVAAVIVEGIFFQGAFAIIFWIKERYPGKMPGLTFSNDLISADERLHTDHSVEQYRLLPGKLPQMDVNAMFESAMEIERFFVAQFMDDGVLGLSKKHLLEHLEYMCDFWLVELGYAKRFETKNPLEYMEKIGMLPRTNFFERRNREYRRSKSQSNTISADSFRPDSLDL